MADSILGLIAQPKIPSFTKQFLAGREYKRQEEERATATQQAQQVRTALASGDPMAVAQAGDVKSAETLQKIRAGISATQEQSAVHALLGTAMTGNKDILKNETAKLPDGSIYKKIFSEGLNLEGKDFDSFLMEGVENFQRLGLLEAPAGYKKTQEDVQREIAAKEANVEIAKRNILLRAAELNRQGEKDAFAKAKAEFEQQYGSLEAGMYRPDPNDPTKIVPLAGSKEEIKRKEKVAAIQEEITGQLSRTQNVMRSLEQVKQNIGSLTAGFGGTLLSKIPGTEARDLKQALTTIVGNIGFDRLSQMRKESPTGGALGQVSERELAQLNASIAALTQDQSPERLAENIDHVIDLYSKMQSKLGQQINSVPKSQPTQFTEGQTATNPNTGEKLIFRGGQWQRM